MPFLQDTFVAFIKSVQSPCPNSSDTLLQSVLSCHSSNTIRLHLSIPSRDLFFPLASILRPSSLSSPIRILATFAEFVSTRVPVPTLTFACIPAVIVSCTFVQCLHCDVCESLLFVACRSVVVLLRCHSNVRRAARVWLPGISSGSFPVVLWMVWYRAVSMLSYSTEQSTDKLSASILSTFSTRTKSCSTVSKTHLSRCLLPSSSGSDRRFCTAWLHLERSSPRSALLLRCCSADLACC